MIWREFIASFIYASGNGLRRIPFFFIDGQYTKDGKFLQALKLNLKSVHSILGKNNTLATCSTSSTVTGLVCSCFLYDIVLHIFEENLSTSLKFQIIII